MPDLPFPARQRRILYSAYGLALSAVRILPYALPLAFFILFYFYPLARIVGVSLDPAMLATLTEFRTWHVLRFTFGQAALSTLLTLIAGLPGAYLVARYSFRGKDLVRALTAVPFVMPTLVVAAGFNTLLGERGWIQSVLPGFSITGLGAILLAHIFYNTTIVIRVVGDYWSHLDPRLSQAARTLGTAPLQTFLRITLPLLAPALLASALLVFIFDFTSFGVILVLGGPRFATLEVEIYRQTLAFFNLPAAATLSLLQLACTFAFALLYTRQSANAARPLGLRSAEFTQRPLVTAARRLGAALVIASLFILLLSPLAALAARSITRIEPGSGLTLDYYTALFTNQRGQAFFITPANALRNSFQYALVTVILSLALGLPGAYALLKTRAYVVEAFLLLPLGTSAVTLGLGYLVAFSGPPFNLRASPLLIPLAHTLIAFPFVVRTLLPTWRSIRPSWRAAAATLGASPSEVWRRIDLPLVGRAAVVAAAFAFAISLGEFGATALITRPEFPTASVAIYTFIGRPGALNYGRALAMSTLLMAATALSILLIERLRIKGVAEF